MKDGIIKGTGNSRNLKSVSNFLSLYPTYADFAAALIAGALPIDLAGINADGWQQLATALSKANLLSDSTAALINTLVGSTPSTPDAALSLITGKAQTLYNERVQIATGSYTGTGTYGSSYPTVITLGFRPKFGAVKARSAGPNNIYCAQLFIGDAPTTIGFIQQSTGNIDLGSNNKNCVSSPSNTGASFYNTDESNGTPVQCNYTGVVYDFVFIG